jgi:hypothetical protein
MGYLGYALIGGTGYFLTGSSLNAVQTVNAPRLVAGSYVIKGFNMGKVEIGGNLTGPLHEYAQPLISQALERSGEGDHMDKEVEVGIAFFGEGSPSGKLFEGCSIASLTVSATAGDVINFAVEFMGKTPPSDFSSVYEGVPCSKLLTWDRMAVDCGLDSPIQAFTTTINNNLERQYNIQDINSLYPVDITAGIREITGTISLYANEGMPPFGADSFDDYPAAPQLSIDVSIDGLMSLSIPAVMHRPEGAATTGAAIYTLGFTSVCATD